MPEDDMHTKTNNKKKTIKYSKPYIDHTYMVLTCRDVVQVVWYYNEKKKQRTRTGLLCKSESVRDGDDWQIRGMRLVFRRRSLHAAVC